MEQRSTTFCARVLNDDAGNRTIKGTAIVFERWQKVGKSNFSELVRRNAVAKDANIRALINHDPEKYLGSVDKNSLKITQSITGLDFELRVPKTSNGNDLLAILENEGGELPTSIGFNLLGSEFEDQKSNHDDAVNRTYSKIDLREISLLVGQEPAWQGVSASNRSQKEAEWRERELWLCSNG